jgi:hypothetical protein
MDFILDDTNLSSINYDKILSEWSKLNLKSGSKFDAKGITYSKNEADRQILID